MGEFWILLLLIFAVSLLLGIAEASVKKHKTLTYCWVAAIILVAAIGVCL